MQKTLFQSALGEGFKSLPAAVQGFHTQLDRPWRGQVWIKREPTAFAGLASILLGLPKSAEDVPISVHVAPNDQRETWTRNFNGQILYSILRPASRRGHIIERFGIFQVEIALIHNDAKLYFVPQRWWGLGLPMPKALLPKGESFEFEQDGQFNFDIRFELPIFGLIVSYKGWLAP